MAGLTFAQQLPWLLFSLLSGALVDRLDRRRLMAAVDLFRTAVVGALGVAVMLGWASLPLIYAAFFLLGTAETLFANASIAIMLGAGNFTFFATFSVLVLFAQDVLGLGSVGYGVLLTAGGVGGVLSSLLAERVGARFGTGRALFLVLLV